MCLWGRVAPNGYFRWRGDLAMLKVVDNTSKQELSYINMAIWDDQIIRKILIDMKSVRGDAIYINDITVNEYNDLTNQVLPKSNASLVNRIRRLNKQNYFDDLVSK